MCLVLCIFFLKLTGFFDMPFLGKQLGLFSQEMGYVWSFIMRKICIFSEYDGRHLDTCSFQYQYLFLFYFEIVVRSWLMVVISLGVVYLTCLMCCTVSREISILGGRITSVLPFMGRQPPLTGFLMLLASGTEEMLSQF